MKKPEKEAKAVRERTSPENTTEGRATAERMLRAMREGRDQEPTYVPGPLAL